MITYCPDQHQDIITAKGFGSQVLNWTVHYKTVTSTVSYRNYDPHSSYPPGYTIPSYAPLNFPLDVVSQIDIPAQIGSQQGQLFYNFSYGEDAGGNTNGTGELVSS